MSWINSNATYKQSSKNDLSFYHGFSKTPVEPASNGTAATKLGNASTKSGHTVIGSEVWAEEIPWFGLVASKDSGVSRLSGRTKLNDLVKVVDQNNQIYKYIGEENATFTKENWDSYWTPITIKNGDTIVNADGVPVLRYYEGQPMQVLTSENNAGITSNGYATRLFVNEDTHTGQTSGGSVVSQFAAGTDNIKNGIPSAELNPVLYYGTTKKEAGTHYYDYNVSGTVLWNENVTSKGVKISCFRYIGKTVTGQLSSISSSVKTHTSDISAIKAQLGMGGTGEDGTPSVTDRVDANETALKVLLGLAEGDEVKATESIATTAANAISASLTGDTDGTIGKAIADAKKDALDAINAIQHFSVEIVPEGQTIESVTPLVENTIYLVKDANAAEGTYIEYIAYKPAGSESVVTEKIGSTAIDLSGYTTDAEHEALQGRVSTAEGQIATITSTDAAKEGSIAKALADAKTYAEGQASAAKSGAEQTAANALSTARTEITAEIAAAKAEAIASAEVTITAGTGIVVTGEGKGTTFQIAVSDDVATAAALSALSQVVASNKTELEGKITAAESAASTALETAKTEIKGTTDALAGRLQTAEGQVSTLEGQVSTLEGQVAALTSGDNSVAKQIETAKTEIKSTTDALDTRLQTAEGKVSTLEGQVTALTTGDNSVAKQIETAATAIKGQTLEQTGTLTGMFSVQTVGSVGTGITAINISDAGLSAAITKAKTDAETTAANALSTARGEITTEITTAVSGLETKLTTGEDSLGGRVTALETATGTTLPAAIEQALEDAKAYSDSLHTTSLDYVVLGDSESLPNASAATLGKIYLVASQNAPTADGAAISGSYVEYMTRKVGEGETATYTWEKIGTTAADLSAYAKTSEVNAAVASVQGDVAALETTHATDKAALEASIATKVGDVQWFGENDIISTKAEVKDGKLVVAEQEVTNPNGHYEAWDTTADEVWNKDITKVVNNEAFIGDTKFANVELNRLKTSKAMFGYNTNLSEFASDLPQLTNGHSMFLEASELTSFCGDLSSLTEGSWMFSDDKKLTTFISDLGSLISGDYMFSNTNLSLESVEHIVDTINEYEGTIEISWSTLPAESERQAFVDELSRIVDKGWKLSTNSTLHPLFDDEKYQIVNYEVQPLDLDSEPQTVYYVVKK